MWMFILAFLLSPHTDEVSPAVMLETPMLEVLCSNLCRAPVVLTEDFHVFSSATHRVVPRLDHVLDPPSPYLCTKLNGVISHKTVIFISHNIFLCLCLKLAFWGIISSISVVIPWRWRQWIPPKLYSISVRLYGVSSLKTVILINLNRFFSRSLSPPPLQSSPVEVFYAQFCTSPCWYW